jgi:DNA-binding HxlR family transcriptional regulator
MADRQTALCARFHTAVELIGRRWAGAIIQVLMAGRRRYCDLKTAVPDISDRMLSERLRELEDEGLVRRIVTPETPVRVEYELTKKGAALDEALAAIGDWATAWVELGSKAKPAAARARRRSA